MAKLNKKDEAVLRAAARDPIGFEITSVAQMEAGLRREYARDVAARDAVLENAYLEAMLVHARCLIEFLVRGGNSDLRRYHYLPGFELSDEDIERATARWKDISAWLSHLSWKRVQAEPVGDSPDWTLTLATDVLDLFDQFIDALGRDRPAFAEFNTAMTAARHCLSSAPPIGRQSVTTTLTETAIRPGE